MRARRALRFCLLACAASASVAGGAGRADLQQRHRADRLDAMRAPVIGRAKSVPSASSPTVTCGQRADADRGGHARGGSCRRGSPRPGRANSRTSGASPPPSSSRFNDGSRAALLKATPPTSRRCRPGTTAGGSAPPTSSSACPRSTPCRRMAPTCFARSSSRFPRSRPRYVRAMEFRPGNARVVHHANIGVDRTRSSRLLDERDPEPGYVGGMVPSATYPEGQLLGWTPGQAAHAVPPGMAWRLEPGQRPRRPAAPAADRQAGAAAGLGRSVLHRAGPDARAGRPAARQRDDRHPARRRRSTSSSDRYVVPVDVEVLAIQPHAHNLARRMAATATLPDGSTRWLISIADWDFRWQDVYRYAHPIVLPKGTTIAMRYTYDNSVEQPAQSASPAGAGRLGPEHLRRDGRPVDPDGPARQRRLRGAERGRPAQAPHRRPCRVHQVAAGGSHRSAAPRRRRRALSGGAAPG